MFSPLSPPHPAIRPPAAFLAQKRSLSIDLRLSHEQRLLVKTVRDFIATELAPLEKSFEKAGRLDEATAKTIFAKSSALGLYGMNFPEEHGGGGLRAFDTKLVEEQFGRTTDILIRRALCNV